MEQLPFIGFVLAAFCAGAWVAYIVIPLIPKPRLPDLSRATGAAKSFAGSNIRLPLPLVLAGVIALAAWGAANYKPPVPPEPVPPTPIPVVVDKLDVLIVRETEDTTPELARAITSLRSGPSAEYLAGKGHRLQVLDDDATDAAGQPVKVLQPFAPFAVPELLLLADGTLIHRQALPATADEVISVIRAHGG